MGYDALSGLLLNLLQKVGETDTMSDSPLNGEFRTVMQPSRSS